ncbi:hypothetical protein H920_14814 [Fukomys damarensis]|uniref:Uncharacterized protein n=1 Tax=Fukomys damarensis TaxID=885580 RepID=A0A091D0D2_FUKDA|nr:hypothetical protein H920_14814 [Fukomys damarensis]
MGILSSNWTSTSAELSEFSKSVALLGLSFPGEKWRSEEHLPVGGARLSSVPGTWVRGLRSLRFGKMQPSCAPAAWAAPGRGPISDPHSPSNDRIYIEPGRIRHPEESQARGGCSLLYHHDQETDDTQATGSVTQEVRAAWSWGVGQTKAVGRQHLLRTPRASRAVTEHPASPVALKTLDPGTQPAEGGRHLALRRLTVRITNSSDASPWEHSPPPPPPPLRSSYHTPLTDGQSEAPRAGAFVCLAEAGSEPDTKGSCLVDSCRSLHPFSSPSSRPGSSMSPLSSEGLKAWKGEGLQRLCCENTVLPGWNFPGVGVSSSLRCRALMGPRPQPQRTPTALIGESLQARAPSPPPPDLEGSV